MASIELRYQEKIYYDNLHQNSYVDYSSTLLTIKLVYRICSIQVATIMVCFELQACTDCY
jgi:hypothetical protein